MIRGELRVLAALFIENYEFREENRNLKNMTSHADSVARNLTKTFQGRGDRYYF